jgi:hypothetical protein
MIFTHLISTLMLRHELKCRLIHLCGCLICQINKTFGKNISRSRLFFGSRQASFVNHTFDRLTFFRCPRFTNLARKFTITNSMTLPEFKFKFPASTTHRLPPLKYKPRFQFFSGSHAMSSAKWSWSIIVIIQNINQFITLYTKFEIRWHHVIYT